MLSRAGRRAGDRRGPQLRGEPVRAAPDHLPRRSRPDSAARAARHGYAVGHADHDQLRRMRRDRLPLVRQHGRKPLYAFGHGLSYTTFAYTNLAVHGGETITTSFTLMNTGSRYGADVPQLYLTAAAGEQRMRLLGFERIELTPGESRQVTITADPRLWRASTPATDAGTSPKATTDRCRHRCRHARAYRGRHDGGTRSRPLVDESPPAVPHAQRVRGESARSSTTTDCVAVSASSRRAATTQSGRHLVR